jgi:hypothetical protein
MNADDIKGLCGVAVFGGRWSTYRQLQLSRQLQDVPLDRGDTLAPCRIRDQQ